MRSAISAADFTLVGALHFAEPIDDNLTLFTLNIVCACGWQNRRKV
jgi:hypothetical protein